MPVCIAAKSASVIDGVRSATNAMSRGLIVPPPPQRLVHETEVTEPVSPLGIPIAGAK